MSRVLMRTISPVGGEVYKQAVTSLEAGTVKWSNQNGGFAAFLVFRSEIREDGFVLIVRKMMMRSPYPWSRFQNCARSYTGPFRALPRSRVVSAGFRKTPAIHMIR